MTQENRSLFTLYCELNAELNWLAGRTQRQSEKLYSSCVFIAHCVFFVGTYVDSMCFVYIAYIHYIFNVFFFKFNSRVKFLKLCHNFLLVFSFSSQTLCLLIEPVTHFISILTTILVRCGQKEYCGVDRERTLERFGLLFFLVSPLENFILSTRSN